MAFIKFDRNQTKAVVALLTVLAVVIGVTAYRMHSTRVVRADAKQAAAVNAARPDAATGPFVERSTRNPFKKPETIVAAMMKGVTNPPEAVPDTGALGTVVPPLSIGHGPLLPGSNGPSAEMQPGQASVSQAAAPNVVPEFTLMATITSAGKSSAVIRIGDSKTKVVRVGDTVDGRFRLHGLTADCAILTDGAVIVSAKRGHIEDGQTTAQ